MTDNIMMVVNKTIKRENKKVKRSSTISKSSNYTSFKNALHYTVDNDAEGKKNNNSIEEDIVISDSLNSIIKQNRELGKLVEERISNSALSKIINK